MGGGAVAAPCVRQPPRPGADRIVSPRPARAPGAAAAAGDPQPIARRQRRQQKPVVAVAARLVGARGHLVNTAAILSIATAIPEHRLEAAEALAALRRFFPQLDRLDGEAAALGTRYTCEPVERLLEPRGLTDISRSYLRHAGRLALECASKALAGAGVTGADIDLVISVSCTGYLVPSLDVHIAEQLGLRPDVLRLPITELGCSAGAAA